MIPIGLLPRLLFDIRVRFMGQRRRRRSHLRRVRVRINIVIFALIALDLFSRIVLWFASSVFNFSVLIANRLSRSFVIVILSIFLICFRKNITIFVGSIDVTQNSLNLS